MSLDSSVTIALLTFVGVVLVALIGGGVTLAVAMVKWQADNRLLWLWNRALVDHIYRGLPPPAPAPPAGLFD